MSYEGYTAYICANGHEHKVTVDFYSDGPQNTNCPICGAKPKYAAEVDETNGIDEFTDNSYIPRVNVIREYTETIIVTRKIVEPAPGARWRQI